MGADSMRDDSLMDARILAGAKWLDEKYPGWVDRVNLDTLSQANGTLCILTQASGIGVFFYVKAVNGLTAREACAYGFDSWDGEYAKDTENWKRLIQFRRQVVAELKITEPEHAQDSVRAIRIIEMRGPREWVERTLEQSWLQPGRDMSLSIHPPRYIQEIARVVETVDLKKEQEEWKADTKDYLDSLFNPVVVYDK